MLPPEISQALVPKKAFPPPNQHRAQGKRGCCFKPQRAVACHSHQGTSRQQHQLNTLFYTFSARAQDASGTDVRD